MGTKGRLDLSHSIYYTKGQLISVEFFLVLDTPKYQRNFLQISALASKCGGIKKIQTLYYVK